MDVWFRKRREDVEDVSFPQLVFAHFLRQRELYAAAQAGAPTAERALQGPAEVEYQRCLKAFTRRNGEIFAAYWCTHEISAVALTARSRWGWRGLLPHHELVTRLHGATDWATQHAQAISQQLYACESLAIRANEVLLGTSERIVMQLVLAQSARLLAVVDRDEQPTDADLKAAVAESRAQLKDIHQYYSRAGEKAVRVFYVGGMLGGMALLGAAVLVLQLTSASDAVLASVGMGGVGAVVSVLTRMANRDANFHLDHEVGQKEARRLGAFRPFIGATFGAVIYLAIASGLVVIGGTKVDKTLPFYAVVAFLAGFSERWAKVVLDLTPPESPEPKPAEEPGRKRAAAAEGALEAPPEPAV
jgi:hypothetical protein